MYKIVVAGGRDFNDYKLLTEELIKVLRGYRPSEVEVVSGGARGADKLGERFAKEKNCHLKLFLPDWDSYGYSAGIRRNADMVNYADACLLFWDGKSTGTASTIKFAEKKGILLKVIRYEG
jgi:hypothetical protein